MLVCSDTDLHECITHQQVNQRCYDCIAVRMSQPPCAAVAFVILFGGQVVHTTRSCLNWNHCLRVAFFAVEFGGSSLCPSHFTFWAPSVWSTACMSINFGCHVEEASRESVDALCRKLTAPWVRERALEAGGGCHTGVKAPVDTEAVAAAAAAPKSSAAARALPNSGATAVREAPPMARAVPAVADIEDAVNVCGFYEGYTAAATDAVLPPGVYTLHVCAPCHTPFMCGVPWMCAGPRSTEHPSLAHSTTNGPKGDGRGCNHGDFVLQIEAGMFT